MKTIKIDKTLFECNDRNRGKICDRCQYKYPRIIEHAQCNFRTCSYEKHIINKHTYRASFRLAGGNKNTSCQPQIKFTEIV